MKKVLGIGVFAAAALLAGEGEKIRVFIGNSDSWEQRGGGLFGGGTGGARNQTPELIKTFGQKCGAVTITNNKDKADFTVTFSHEGGKGWAQRDNKIAVFSKDGDVVYSDAARSLGGAVEGACRAITK
jgi:hypothetical protein